MGHNSFLTNQLCRDDRRERSGCGWSPCWCWDLLSVCPGNMLSGPGHRGYAPESHGASSNTEKRGWKSQLLSQLRGGAAYSPLPTNTNAACGWVLLLCCFSSKPGGLICLWFRVMYLVLDQKGAEKEAHPATVTFGQEGVIPTEGWIHACPSLPPSLPLPLLFPSSPWVPAFVWPGTVGGERYQPQDQTGHYTWNYCVFVATTILWYEGYLLLLNT